MARTRNNPRPRAPDTIGFPEADAQAVAWVRAVEKSDRQGLLLSLGERRQASVEALAIAKTAKTATTAEDTQGPDSTRLEPSTGSDEVTWIARRAVALQAIIGDRMPSAIRLLRWTRPFRGITLPVVLVCCLLGLLTQALESGDGRRIQVLAVPLLGLVLWNLVMMSLLVARRWLPIGGLGHPLVDTLLDIWRRRLRRRIPSVGRDLNGDPNGILARAAGAYLEAWLPAIFPLAAARARRLLHLAATALVAGVVLGMYLRGLVWEYRMTWESTFLSARTVGGWLEWILGPASLALSLPVPDVLELRSPGSGPAAPWIHLYGMTALLFAVIPRLFFAAVEGFRCARLAAKVEQRFPEGDRRRLRAAVSTLEQRVDIWPFSFRPPDQAVSALRGLLLDLLGPRTEVRLREPIEYGTDPATLEPPRGRLLVVLFNLAQPPEAEVHGELLESLRRDLGDGQCLIAAVDASSYRQRIQGDDAVARDTSRLQDRRRNWDRVIRDRSLDTLHLDLRGDLQEDLLARCAAVAWPTGSLDRARP